MYVSMYAERLPVQEPLDTHFRSFLKRLVNNLHLGNLAVRRKRLVQNDLHVVHLLGKSLPVKSVSLNLLLVKVDERDELRSAVNDHRLDDIRLVVHRSLDFLRLDVLSV